MFTWTTKASPPALAGAPTPLLTHLTGEFAPRIAGLWPQPHAVFLTAGAERRHLVCLALAHGDLNHETADGLLHWPLRRAIKVALPGAPEGLARALTVLGETAWTAGAYADLIRMLGEPEAAKRLRHAAEITAVQVASLAATPLPLLRAGIDRLNLSAPVMAVVQEAFEIIRARDGELAAQHAAMRWGAAATPEKLRERIGEDLMPTLPPPPFVGTAQLKPLATKAAINEAALRYRNCLAGQTSGVANGDAAYFEWTPAPGAIVEIRADRLRGWVFTEAKLAGNDTVPPAVRTAICEALTGIGVHVGRPVWALDQALESGLVYGHTPWSLEDVIEGCFTN